LASSGNMEISSQKDLDLYGEDKLIGYTKGNTEFGAMQQMHVYGGNSLITAKDKIEYKAPDMNKLPDNGNFEYTKEKQIISATWMDAEMNIDIDDALIGEAVSIMVQTRNYEEGEIINLNIKELNGKEVEEGKTSVPYSGKIDKNGFAILKEEIEIRESPKEVQSIANAKKIEEESKANEVYKTKDGKNYTFSEWKEYEEMAYQEYIKERERKSKGFWG
ncbi:MAG: Rhs element Vgr protein, partial [Moheibacter sp.]